MARTIKLFLYVQKSFERVGIDTQQQNQHRLLSSKSVYFLIFMTHIFILMVISGVTATQSIYDYALSVYLSTATFVIMSLYVLNIFHSGNICKLIEKIEQFIRKSKFEQR